ncbi:MAG TPA: RagB/SusD family nutrient uptake outer membrane protein [Proteiniphilum sp.]|nr:RagB/SusD family nutrient uptake outer membrane protein [Proteiniphilum sp.]
MKRLNKYSSYATKLLVVTLLTVGTVGCSDFLELQPPAEISDANFWTGEGDAKLALVGCYRFSSGWSNDNFDSAQGLLYLDFSGGNGTEKENFTTNMASSNTVATNGNLNWYWRSSYEKLAKYNTFLDNIGTCPMDENKKTQWIAEVKTLRAYFLFNLAFYFQNVPMPLTTISVEEANTMAQSSQADVYAQVESDLKESISVLPLEQKDANLGRISKGAARTLLARLYLAQNKFAEAAAVLKDIIDSNVYALDRRNGDDSYEKFFHDGGETSPEAIFSILGLKDKFTNVRYIYMLPEMAGGWHQFAVYNELVKSYFAADGKSIDESEVYDDNDPYVNRDIRLYASVFLPPLGTYPGTTFKGKTYNCYLGPNTADSYNRYTLFNGYCPKKGADPEFTDIWNNYTHTPLMRYAEVLLSYLEAVNEATPGAVDQALLDVTINDVRDRVKLPGYSKAELSSQEAVREAVRKERRVELAFEGLRYFDVLRWGVAKELLNHTFTGVKLSDDPSAPNYRGSGSSASPVDEDMYYQFEKRMWSDHNRYFPIPQNELNVNKNLKQNSGYN